MKSSVSRFVIVVVNDTRNWTENTYNAMKKAKHAALLYEKMQYLSGQHTPPSNVLLISYLLCADLKGSALGWEIAKFDKRRLDRLIRKTAIRKAQDLFDTITNDV